MDEEPIRLTFEYSGAEMARAARLMLKGSRHEKSRLVIIVLAIAVLFTVTLARTKFSYDSTPTTAPAASAPDGNLLAFGIGMLPWLLVFFVVWFVLFRVLRRNKAKLYEQARIAGRQFTWEFRSDGITASSPYQREEVKWEFFVGLVETEEFFLLKSSDIAGRVIPKRVMNNAVEMDRLRAMLREHIKVGYPNVPRSGQRPSDLSAPPPLPPQSMW
jgi:hypothetical protein